MLTTHIHTPGFANPVRDSQQVFRAVLEALARPVAAQHLTTDITPPEPLGATTGAVILALCDEQTPLWLDPTLRAAPEVAAWIAFHSGARIVDRAADAQFVIASTPEQAPRLSDLMQGTDEEPHRSATLIIEVGDARGATALAATGPGIENVVHWDGAGLPAGFLPQWQENRAQFPRGIDIVLAAETTVRGLPRTTALTSADTHTEEQRGA